MNEPMCTIKPHSTVTNIYEICIKIFSCYNC